MQDRFVLLYFVPDINRFLATLQKFALYDSGSPLISLDS
jgi:hypothetical protein